jgi:hypothetical protein
MLILWFLFSTNGKSKFILLTTYGSIVIATILINQPWLLNIISMSSLPLILTLTILNALRKSNLVLFNRQIWLNYISLIGIILAIISISITAITIYQHNNSLPPINYLYYIFLLMSILNPLLLVIIGIYYPSRIILEKLLRNLDRFKNNKNNNKVNLKQISNRNINLKKRILCLLGIVLLSSIIVYIPHLPTINKSNQNIGDDSNDYVNFLNPLKNFHNLQQTLNVFTSQLQNDRSLSLITFYLLSSIIDESNLTHAIELLPLILSPLLIITIYFLTMEITSNPSISLISSFLTATSFQTLAGIYGGLYANWFSIMFGYIAILFLIRSLKKFSILNIAMFSLLMIIVLLTHEPTWPILSLILSIFLLIVLYLYPKSKKTIVTLFISIIPSIIIEITRIMWTKNSGVARDIAFANSQGAGLHDFYTIWKNLISSTHTYLGGLFGNSIVLLLVIYWLHKCDLKEKTNLLLVVFLSITTLPIFFGDKIILCRVLYEIPFQIPAAIALDDIKKNNGSMFTFTICLWIVILAIRSVSNFYFVPQ